MGAAAHDRDRDELLTIVDDIWRLLDEIARTLDEQHGDDPDES